MATATRFLPFVVVDVDTYANLIAQTWTAQDVSNHTFVYCAENGLLYLVNAAGSGLTALSLITRSGGVQGRLGIPLHNFRLMTSGADVGNIAAIGGVGASDSDPILRGDANNSQEWSWANGAHVGAIGTEVPLPNDFDGSQDATLELDVYSGSSDAATFTVDCSFDGGSKVTYTATDGAKSATRHTITATLLAADLPDSCKTASILLTPAAHATNAIQLCRAAVRFNRK